MLIAVTGSSGRLGRVVVRELLANGHDVRAIDVVEGEANAPKTLKVDLTRLDDVIGAIKDVDAIAHLGNFPGLSPENASTGFANNVHSTFNVFHAAEGLGIKRVIYASSFQSYGCFRNRLDEIIIPPRYLPLDEDHPLQASHPYSMSKAYGEHIAEAYWRRRPQELCTFSLRFTQIYWGHIPRDSYKTPPPMWASLATFVQGADAARAVRLCCESDRVGHTPLNIVSPQSRHVWTEDGILEAYGCVPEFRKPMRHDEPLASCKRAQELLGFTAEMGLHEPEPAFQKQ